MKKHLLYSKEDYRSIRSGAKLWNQPNCLTRVMSEENVIYIHTHVCAHVHMHTHTMKIFSHSGQLCGLKEI